MHHIAIASKHIAEASKRDSYAMKTIGEYLLFDSIHSLHPEYLGLKIEPKTNISSNPNNNLPPRHLCLVPLQHHDF